jgi:beta-phosphoglucomutase family hydrolase
MSNRAVLWDLDGTLVDSSDHHWSSWRDTLTAEGVDFTYEMFLSDFGKRNDDILRIRLGEEAPPESIARVADAKETLYRSLVREQGVVVLPGVPEWLERLSAGGWRQALATSAPPANVEAIFEVTGMGRYFQAVVSSEQVARGKPHPDDFLAAAERVGVHASRCVVVEDAPSGVEAARRAEMRSVGVLTTHDALEADLVVASLADLPDDALDRLLAT